MRCRKGGTQATLTGKRQQQGSAGLPVTTPIKPGTQGTKASAPTAERLMAASKLTGHGPAVHYAKQGRAGPGHSSHPGQATCERARSDVHAGRAAARQRCAAKCCTAAAAQALAAAAAARPSDRVQNGRPAQKGLPYSECGATGVTRHSWGGLRGEGLAYYWQSSSAGSLGHSSSASSSAHSPWLASSPSTASAMA